MNAVVAEIQYHYPDLTYEQLVFTVRFYMQHTAPIGKRQVVASPVALPEKDIWICLQKRSPIFRRYADVIEMYEFQLRCSAPDRLLYN